MNDVKKIENLYREGFKQVVDKNRLDKMISEAKGIEKQRLQEFKWFVQCADIDKADIMGLIMLNKSYQFWQSIFLYILKDLSREDNSTEDEAEEEKNIEQSVNRTLTDDEIEILAPNERNHIEDYEEDDDEDEEDYEEEEEE